MIIRQATLDDKEEIIHLIGEFFEESLSEYKLTLDSETIGKTTIDFICNKIVIVAEKDKKIIGVIGGLISPSIFDSNQLFAQEFIWYVSKNERESSIGIRLLKAFEEECKRQKANLISMIRMNNLYADTLDRFYKMRHYKLMENHYIKGD